MNWLEIGANIAEILTALVAVVAYGHFRLSGTLKRWRLESYLEHEWKANQKQSHTIYNIMSKKGLTEDEIIRAVFHSYKINCLVHVDKTTHLAGGLLFQYKEPPKSN